MKTHRRAFWWLIVTTAVWGVSFPLMKVLPEIQRQAVPHAPSWFFSSWMLFGRCFFSALLLLIFCPRLLQGATRAEWQLGILLALCAAPGLLLQADGLGDTEASTSAFLTQFYCVLLPLWTCGIRRQRPSLRLIICTLLVVTGVAILSKLNWKTFHIGKGEWKTLIATLFFTAQILVLEMPRFRECRATVSSLIMFLGIAVVAFVAAASWTGQWQDVWLAWSPPYAVGTMIVLTLGCTLFCYLMMNRWQRHVSATEAGLIYCMEPVFTSIYVLFLPGWLSVWSAHSYPNEMLTTALLVGGGLITLANILLQIPSNSKK